ncbi:hypothetical protein LTR36_009768 [Oleoguttula mirabilis]|uniref:Uncharacterized protein n=1 Tax=Oleoguttula mirabilis TaxID=1507867 RepID=A0AAV9J573_9PEZI|nr:hypothetical protein LTR36_009768 [Oleoguttula mirabilis]
MKPSSVLAFASLLSTTAYACESCEHPERDVVLTRNFQRAAMGGAASLSNVQHTTDAHGWREGRFKEKNYGADWSDFVSLVRDMRSTAEA